MIPAELIERKRDGRELTPDELRTFLDDFAAGDVADYQMSAFLMAVYFRGLSEPELRTMTRAMLDSGARLDFGDGGPPAVDKHSTGGVGDTVSLVLAPLLAEAGLRVPMMSGRGLGHTGGTLDKLESIPGFRVDLELGEFREVLSEVGCAMIGPTDDIAPLDGRLYGLRDVTGTVPSIPLIASSIVSKKVAEGIEALVLDVKFGRGAFMGDQDRARQLARTLVGLARSEGVEARALLTEMDFPLGRAVGNALEVAEAVSCLTGHGPEDGPSDLREVTLALGAELLVAAGGESDPAAARGRLETLLESGAAADRFARMVRRQGGDHRIVERPERLPRAPVVEALTASRDGYLEGLDARVVGLAAVDLGAGRRRMGESVDPAVGVVLRRRRGDRLERGDEIAAIHARTRGDAEVATRRLSGGLELGARPPEVPESRVRDRIL